MSHAINYNKRKMSLTEWMEKCRADQENFSNLLGDRIWDKFLLPENEAYLFQKIAIALYGKPHDPEKDDFGLADDKKKVVNDIKEKCKKHSSSTSAVYMGIVFVHVYEVNGKKELLVTLIRIMDTNTVNMPWKNTFIDHLGRVYSGWEKYKADNTWDMCWLCVPENGYYCPELSVDFLNQSDRGKVLQVVDKASTVTNVISSVGLIAGTLMTFFPPTIPIGLATVTASSVAAVPGAAYGVGRSVTKLHDRVVHEQSISLADAEARQCWFVTTASLLSVGTMTSATLLARSAKAGNLVSSTTRAVCNAISVSSMSLQGVSVVMLVHDLAKKDKISAEDIFQLTTSIFFFTHSVMTFQTASNIIKTAQREQIASMRSGLNKNQKRAYDAMRKGSKQAARKGEASEMHGNARFIREMHKINNPQEFFSHFRVQRNGRLNINKKVSVRPKTFMKLSEAERVTLLDMTKDLKKNKITTDQFQQTPLIKKYNFKVDSHGQSPKKHHVAKTDKVKHPKIIKIGKKNMRLEPHETDGREGATDEQPVDDGNSRVMNRVEDFINLGAGFLGIPGSELLNEVKNEISSKRENNPNPESSAQNGKEEYIPHTSLQNPSNQEVLSNAEFTPEICFIEIAFEMADGDNWSDINWSQDGDSTKCIFTSEKYGPACITFDLVDDGKRVIARLVAEDVDESTSYFIESENGFLNIVKDEKLSRRANNSIPESTSQNMEKDPDSIQNVEDENIQHTLLHTLQDPFNPDVSSDAEFTPETCFIEIAAEMADGDNWSDINWSQDGDSTKCTFTSEKYGSACITFDLVADGKLVIARLEAEDVDDSTAYFIESDNE